MATAVAAPEAWAPGHEATRPRARSGLCGTCWLESACDGATVTLIEDYVLT